MHECAVFELLGDVDLDFFFPRSGVLFEQREEVVQVASVFRRNELDLVEQSRLGLGEADDYLVDDGHVLVLGQQHAFDVVEVSAVGVQVRGTQDLPVEEK